MAYAAGQPPVRSAYAPPGLAYEPGCACTLLCRTPRSESRAAAGMPSYPVHKCEPADQMCPAAADDTTTAISVQTHWLYEKQACVAAAMATVPARALAHPRDIECLSAFGHNVALLSWSI